MYLSEQEQQALRVIFLDGFVGMTEETVGNMYTTTITPKGVDSGLIAMSPYRVVWSIYRTSYYVYFVDEETCKAACTHVDKVMRDEFYADDPDGGPLSDHQLDLLPTWQHRDS